MFPMVMDRITNDIREEAPWIMMFANDIVICSESKEHVEEKLDICFREKRNGECRREVRKRVHAGWNGWRRMSGVIC